MSVVDIEPSDRVGSDTDGTLPIGRNQGQDSEPALLMQVLDAVTQIRRKISQVTRRVDSIENQLASLSVASPRSVASRVSSPKVVQPSPMVRFVVIQTPPTRSRDNVSARQEGSWTRSGQGRTTNVVSGVTADDGGDEDNWSTPCASPDRNYNRTRSRSRSAASRRPNLSHATATRTMSTTESCGRTRSRPHESITSAGGIVPASASATQSSASAAIGLKSKQGLVDRVTVEDHRVVHHHLTMEIGGGRTLEVAESETEDHRTGIARRIGSWMETKMGIWNPNRDYIVPEVAQLGDGQSHRSRSWSIPRKKNWIRPKDYDGSTCVETFLSRFECAAKYNGWNALDKSAHLKTCLVGAAEHLVWSAEEDTYDEMKQKLRYGFGAEEQQEKFRLELRYRRRKPTETARIGNWSGKVGSICLFWRVYDAPSLVPTGNEVRGNNGERPETFE